MSSTPGAPRVVIAGGGPVGSVLALALAASGVPAVLVERRAAPPEPSPDDSVRPIALAEGSRRVLHTLGLWESLAPLCAPIRLIHVSERGRWGSARLAAAEHGVAALGQVIDAGALGAVLARAVRACDGVEVRAPAELTRVGQRASRADCTVSTEQGGESRLEASLLVVADGGRSPLGDAAGLECRERPYGQSAITAVVRPRRAHEGTAFERFTEQGPLALLPLPGERCGLVWTRRPEQAEALLELEDKAFLARLGECFGSRLGGFVETGPRALYPLARRRVRQAFGERLVLVGNAAHVLHPVAGQGLNLGLRDAAWLAETVADAARAGEDPGSRERLAAYAARRGGDQRLTGLFTDALVEVFSNRLPPLVLARGAGLAVLDLAAPVKRLFARQAMGLGVPLPRLARGLAP